MRVAAWNVNGLRARLDFVLHWLDSRAPDVLGMQEIKMMDAAFPHAAFNDLGYQVAVHGQKSWNGVAIASKLPAQVETSGLPGQEDFGARLLTARIDGGGAPGLRFATVYCPNGKNIDHADYPRKLAWFDSLREHLAGVDFEQPFIIGGDFNIVPEPRDCWRGATADGTIFCTDAERRRYQALLDDGLTDLFRHARPDDEAFSWWDYRGGAFHRGMGLRIDMLLATAPVLDRVRDVVIDREFRKKQRGLTASDHAPVYADLD